MVFMPLFLLQLTKVQFLSLDVLFVAIFQFYPLITIIVVAVVAVNFLADIVNEFVVKLFKVL